MTSGTAIQDKHPYTNPPSLVTLLYKFTKEPVMYIITIDTTKCQGEGDCVDTCPSSLFSLVDGKAQVTGDLNECLGCESCVTTCPGEAITLSEN